MITSLFLTYIRIVFEFKFIFFKTLRVTSILVTMKKYKNKLELLKNSIVQINKTASIDRFHETQTDRELIFQQFYF